MITNYDNLLILQSFQIGERNIILFETGNIRSISGQLPNLVCFDQDGSIDWIAELPTSDTGEHYYEVISVDPLVAYSFFSWKCTVDINNGRIVEQEFLK